MRYSTKCHFYIKKTAGFISSSTSCARLDESSLLYIWSDSGQSTRAWTLLGINPTLLQLAQGDDFCFSITLIWQGLCANVVFHCHFLRHLHLNTHSSNGDGMVVSIILGRGGGGGISKRPGSVFPLMFPSRSTPCVVSASLSVAASLPSASAFAPPN